MNKEKRILNQVKIDNIGKPHNPAKDFDEESNNLGPKSQMDFKNLETFENRSNNSLTKKNSQEGIIEESKINNHNHAKSIRKLDKEKINEKICL